MKLKIAQIKTVHEAVKQLDGYQKAVKIDGEDKLVFQPYSLSGKTRYTIAKNLRILGTALEDFNKARDGAILEVTGGVPMIKKEDTATIEKFVAKMHEISEEEVELDGVLKFSLKELGLEEETDLNPFPSSVINGLTPLIK